MTAERIRVTSDALQRLAWDNHTSVVFHADEYHTIIRNQHYVATPDVIA